MTPTYDSIMGGTKTAHAHVQFKIATAAFSVLWWVTLGTQKSSEEEEEDELASPSLRGSTSPITAAKHETSRKKLTIFSERLRAT